MLRKTFGFAVTAASMAAVCLAACGGDSDEESPGSTGKDPTGEGARPPPPANDPKTTVTLALNKLFLGETDRNGEADVNAWKSYGYNLDGIISTKTGTNHCAPKPGIPKSKIQTDGNDGIDNSFGSNLIPIIQNLAGNPTEAITETLTDGSFTLILNLKDSGADQLYGGASFDSLVGGTGPGPLDCDATPTDPNCSPPTFTTADHWPVVPELLTNPSDIDSPKITFPSSYVSGGTWVSGDGQSTLDLTISIQGFDLTLSIARAVITLKASASGATDGVIAGVIPTASLVTELKKVAGGFDPGLCDGPTFDSIAKQIEGASDIMADGTNGDPSQECNGISVGLGFEAGAITLGGIAPAATAPEDPCAPGTGGSGGSGGSGGTGGGTGGSAGAAGSASGGAPSDAGTD
jgi:hypothetical protein